LGWRKELFYFDRSQMLFLAFLFSWQFNSLNISVDLIWKYLGFNSSSKNWSFFEMNLSTQTKLSMKELHITLFKNYLESFWIEIENIIFADNFCLQDFQIQHYLSKFQIHFQVNHFLTFFQTEKSSTINELLQKYSQKLPFSSFYDFLNHHFVLFGRFIFESHNHSFFRILGALLSLPAESPSIQRALNYVKHQISIRICISYPNFSLVQRFINQFSQNLFKSPGLFINSFSYFTFSRFQELDSN
jgi:hypothetical protein